MDIACFYSNFPTSLLCAKTTLANLSFLGRALLYDSLTQTIKILVKLLGSKTKLFKLSLQLIHGTTIDVYCDHMARHPLNFIYRH
jgi:hypothetical protein